MWNLPNESKQFGYIAEVFHSAKGIKRYGYYNIPGLNLSQIIAHSHPIFNLNEPTCAAMTLSISDRWILVNCSEPLSPSVFCHLEHATAGCNKSLSSGLKGCHKEFILSGTLCFNFVWTTKGKKRFLSCCDVCGLHPAKQHHIKQFEFLFNATSEVLPPVVVHPAAGETQIMTYKKFPTGYVYYSEIEADQTAMHLYYTTLLTTKATHDVFKCPNYTSISLQYICDNRKDCIDGADESGCICNETSSLSHNCKYLINTTGTKKCSIFYYSAHNRSCYPYTIASHTTQTRNEFQCTNGAVIDITLLNDLIADCGPEGEDEVFLSLQSVSNAAQSSCRQKGEIPCREGHVRCYNVSDICTYKLNKHSLLEPCRTGDHLQDCTSFQCHSTFNCSFFYCLPWKYVCNGKWDCPGGFDENTDNSCQEETYCDNMFKCHKMATCIHLNDVCDGIPDCYEGDDEFPCVSGSKYCPTNCSCMFHAMVCLTTKVNVKNKCDFPFLFVYLRKQHQHFVMKTISTFQSVVILTATSSGIKEICSTIFSSAILSLDVNSNIIQCIHSQCFCWSSKIRILSLNKNHISHVAGKAFSNLKELAHLDLSDNCLQTFSFQTVSKEMLSLVLTNNSLDKISHTLFLFSTVKFIVVEKYQVCCLAPASSRCTAQAAWYMSCDNLLPNTSVKVCCYTVSALIVVCCVLSIITQRLDKASAFSNIAISVNATDFTCAAPLILLCIADYSFGDDYFLEEHIWRTSPKCFACFGSLLFFLVCSPFFLGFLSCARLMLVMFPLKTKFTQTKYVNKNVFAIFAGSLLYSVSITLFVTFYDKVVPNHLCSPVIDFTHSFTSIKCITWPVVVLEISFAILIVVVSIKIILELRKSQKMLEGYVSKMKSNVSPITQLVCVAVSNILCWLSSSLVFLICMFTETFSTELLFWTAIVIVPINSLIIPVVFLLTTMKKILNKKQKKNQFISAQ